MDSCQRFKEMVSGYIEGELDRQSQSLMEQHLRDCLGCEKNISQLKSLLYELRKLPKIAVSPDFETVLRARISMESSLARRRVPWFSGGQLQLPAYAFAAIVVIVALFSTLIFNQLNRNEAPQASIKNGDWYQKGVEKVDPVTNERYIYIIETQPVPPINSDSMQPSNDKAYPDSIQTFKDNQSWYKIVPASETKIY